MSGALQAVFQNQRSFGPPLDAQFNYVTMLLHGDGTNGAQNNTFLDSSTNAFSITRNGNTTQGSFSPYGSNWSNYFDGSADYIQTGNATNLALGTGNFTIEGWFNRTSGTNNGLFQLSTTVGGFKNDGTNNLAVGPNADSFNYYANNNTNTSSTVSIANNTWHHFALVRNSTTTTIYFNGVSVGSVSDSTNYTGTYLVVGGYYSTTYVWDGYISNFRVVKGTAVYTSAFTPPTAPLLAITNTQLLTCQANRFIDSSANAYALTVIGDTSVQRFNPFGTSTAYSTSVIGGSGYFDGIGAYLNGPTDAAFAFGTGDFTLSAWVYILNGTSAQIIWTNQTTSSASAPNIGFFILGNKVCINNTNTSHSESTGTIANNSWNYVGVTKASGTYTFYINGSASGTTGSIGTNNFTENACRIGYGNYGSGFYFGGYIADLRVIKGSAVTPSVPTAPVGTVTNTQLLLNTTNAGIFDNAMMNDCLTVNNAQVSSTQVKFGTGSMKFVRASYSNGDFLSFPKSPNYDLSGGAFTIEAWVYPTLFDGQYQTIVSRTPTIWKFGFLDNQLVWYNGSANIVSTGTVAVNAWSHVAVTGDGTNVRIFINGVLDTTATGANPQSGLGTLNVGAPANGDYGGRYVGEFYTGYIDDLRITKGFCRYTANFTPPTAAFLNIGPT